MFFAEFLCYANSTKLKFIGRDWATPALAFVAAHDLIEHALDDTGIPEDEMRALGAGVWLRRPLISKDIGYPCTDEQIIKNIGGDIVHNIKTYNVLKLADVAFTNLSPRESDIFDYITELLVKELDGTRFDNIHLINTAIRWARRGYAQSQERFKNAPQITKLYIDLLKGFRDITNHRWRNNAICIISVAIDFDNAQFDMDFTVQN